MITHLTAREWVEVLAIAGGIVSAGGLAMFLSGWFDVLDALDHGDGGDDWNRGPDGWPGWEETRGTQAQTPAAQDTHGARNTPGGGK